MSTVFATRSSSCWTTTNNKAPIKYMIVFCIMVFKHRTKIKSQVIVVTFYSPSFLGQKTTKGLSVFESSCHLPTCPPHTVEASHCPFNNWTSSREAVNTNFYSLWYDPTENRTRVYRFSSRRSIHSTTDRFLDLHRLEKILIDNRYQQSFHLGVFPIWTLTAEQIPVTQIFWTELMFVIPNFVADPIYSWWISRPMH